MQLKEFNDRIISISSSDMPLKVALQLYGLETCSKEWGFTEKPIYNRVYYIYDGKAQCEIDGNTITLKKDHLYIFPSYKKYTFCHDYKEPLKCLYLHLYLSPIIKNSLFSINVEKDTTIYYIIKILENTLTLEHNRSANMILHHAVSLLYYIDYSHTLQMMENEHIEKALIYIEKEYMSKLSNDILANHLGFNTNYFIRLFTKSVGLSPQAYIAQYRLTKAIKLLMSGYPVNQVAHLIGYSDTKAFCRFFRKITGVPPSHYKKYYMNKI